MKITGRTCVVLSFVLAVVMVCASPALAASGEVSGTVSVELKAVAVGVGASWGTGVLKFQGKEYKFKMNGFSVIDVGISTVSSVGEVYNLTKVSDFPGTYSAAEAGIAVGGGAGSQSMKNQNGVAMYLKSTKSGIQFKLAPEGVKIEMVE